MVLFLMGIPMFRDGSLLRKRDFGYKTKAPQFPTILAELVGEFMLQRRALRSLVVLVQYVSIWRYRKLLYNGLALSSGGRCFSLYNALQSTM